MKAISKSSVFEVAPVSALALDTPQARKRNAVANKLELHDRAFHDWYRFVLSFPPHLVRDYIEKFGLVNQQVVLDPFCGTGTTLVESKKQGLRSVGLEANPFAQFASSVKVDWEVDPGLMKKGTTQPFSEL